MSKNRYSEVAVHNGIVIKDRRSDWMDLSWTALVDNIQRTAHNTLKGEAHNTRDGVVHVSPEGIITTWTVQVCTD